MIVWEPRVLAEGLGFPEGPVLLPDGSLAFTEISGQRISIVKDGARATLATLGGGPNGLALAADGSLYCANNGGVNVGPEGYWHAPQPIAGCVQRIGPDGEVAVVADGFDAPAPHRPNDLCFGPDGALYVTDPHNWEDIANLGPGRVWRIASGVVERFAEVPMFVNGIAFGPDGLLYVARSIAMEVSVIEGGTLRRFASLETGFPDGMCFTADGHLIVCGSMGHVIRVFDPDGALVQAIDTGEASEPTNCCLAPGVLYVTLSGRGQVVAVDIEAEPLPLHRG